MSDNKDTLQESILIKKARRRLLGAITILISLLVLSYFFLEDPNKVKKITNVKVSFLSISDNSLTFDQRNKRAELESVQNQILKMEDLRENEAKNQNPNGTYFIQVGIFSNANNAKKIAKKVGDIGFKTKLLPLVLEGQNKIQLVTSSFDNRGNANIALAKIKEAKLPGMIKQKFN
tara:strand:+ start:48482 stop:49009 length:528 start_codon:yes stop_codon:yes gene_type:complete